MISYTFEQLARIIGGTIYNSDRVKDKFVGVVIDSRIVQPSNLFIAIRGEINDGHNYLDQVIKNGVSGIVADLTYPKLDHISGSVAVIGVKDTHKAMLKLAADYRRSLKAKFIAITGSNGKTTTKEFTASLLRAFSDKVYSSPGNLNNLYGVPLSIFEINPTAETVVLELGISTKDEMPKLAEIVVPDACIFTNVGASHLEFLSTKAEVARAKLKMLNHANDKTAVVVNADDKTLVEELSKLRSEFVTFAVDSKADFKPASIETLDDGRTKLIIENNPFIINLPGQHQVYNLLAGYACLRALGFDFTNINTEKIKLNSASLRGEIVTASKITFLLDCYNANPESMLASIKTFATIKSNKRKVIILGDMLELGERSENFHRMIGQALAEVQFDLLLTVGKMAHLIGEELLRLKNDTTVAHYETASIASENISKHLKSDDLVMLKGSRGIALEKIYNVYKNREEAA